MKRIAFLLAVLISTFSMVAQTNNHSSKVAKNLDVFNAIYKKSRPAVCRYARC